jgi:hypothetical protein
MTNPREAWTAQNWQALITNTPDPEERKRIVNELVPPEWRERVIRHSRTVQGLKKKKGR